MAWVTWRQHRSQALGALGLLVALAAAAVLTHLPIGSAFDRDSLSACLPPAARTGCDLIVPHFEGQFGGLVTATRFLALLPAARRRLRRRSAGRPRARVRHLPLRVDAE